MTCLDKSEVKLIQHKHQYAHCTHKNCTAQTQNGNNFLSTILQMSPILYDSYSMKLTLNNYSVTRGSLRKFDN